MAYGQAATTRNLARGRNGRASTFSTNAGNYINHLGAVDEPQLDDSGWAGLHSGQTGPLDTMRPSLQGKGTFCWVCLRGELAPVSGSVEAECMTGRMHAVSRFVACFYGTLGAAGTQKLQPHAGSRPPWPRFPSSPHQLVDWGITRHEEQKPLYYDPRE